MSVWNCEWTDTFNGEANYSWVRRETITVPDMEPDTIYTSAATVAKKRRQHDRQIMRLARQALGLTGLRGRWTVYGDTFEFRPYRMCCVAFVSYDDFANTEAAI